jgi:hypothetical protein
VETSSAGWILLGFGALTLLMGLVGISGWVADIDEGWATIALGAAFVMQGIGHLRRDLDWIAWLAMAFGGAALVCQFINYRRRKAAARTVGASTVR